VDSSGRAHDRRENPLGGGLLYTHTGVRGCVLLGMGGLSRASNSRPAHDLVTIAGVISARRGIKFALSETPLNPAMRSQ